MHSPDTPCRIGPEQLPCPTPDERLEHATGHLERCLGLRIDRGNPMMRAMVKIVMVSFAELVTTS